VGQPKHERVSVSFHYLARLTGDGEEMKVQPFTPADFEKLGTILKSQKLPDLTAPGILDSVKFGKIVPFFDFEKKDDRCYFGKFKAPYSGHSFENSEKGKITAGSVNQRNFNYLLYLSTDGKIYVGAQYLGNYGGWLPLSKALKRMLGSPSKILSTSFRNDLVNMEKAAPKEIEVTIHHQPSKLTADPSRVLRKKIIFQRSESGDEFEKHTKKKLFPLIGKDPQTIRNALLSDLKANGLTEIEDKDIHDCTIVVDVNGKEAKIHFFDQSNVATRFPMQVGLDGDGHPVTSQVREKMLEALSDQIISKVGKD
jgi:hypothetical protein